MNGQKMNEPVKRSDVPVEDTWDLTALYKTVEDWERDLKSVSGLPEKISSYRDTATESPEKLLEVIEALLDADRKVEKIFTYSHMILDQDLSDPVGSEMNQKAMDLITSLSTSASWFNPAVLSVPEETMKNWIENTPLSTYRVWLEDILRNRPHTLSAAEERIMVLASDATRGFMGTFGKLNNVEIPARFPEILDGSGKKIKLSHGNFIPILQGPDIEVRKNAFKGFYKELKGNTETLASLLDGQVRTNIFRAKARNFPSAIEASLFQDRVGKTVYTALINSVHESLPVMHRYYTMKKRVMGLSKMHFYDVYTPTVHDVDAKYTISQAEEMTLEAVKPLGELYTNTLRQGFKDRWTDRYENIGKRSGAYSGGCYDSHPYMLLNFSGTLDSVFTMAHESGHSMHSWFSKNNQPYHTSDYRILVAEVASITNEMLLANYLRRKTDDSDMIAYLIDSQINDFRTTLFRQAMFAEFEMLIHNQVEQGGALSREWLNKTYYDLVKLYHGDAFEYDSDDSLIETEWARIPHFYYNFYVYKYSTGLASAASISSRIINGDTGVVEKYINFLSAGGSKPPLELLRGTGVDLETPAPVKDAMRKLDGLLSDLEKLLEK
ncbi:oligoendopeptidase F [Candidatus Fermentibacteria bacterium]|nr:MAG: oligoendopeptidase F [Candidatus Fermentibacteria bacterium]